MINLGLGTFKKSKEVVSVTIKLVGLISEKFSEFMLKKIKSSATTGLSIISSVWSKSISFTQAINNVLMAVNKESMCNLFFNDGEFNS